MHVIYMFPCTSRLSPIAIPGRRFFCAKVGAKVRRLQTHTGQPHRLAGPEGGCLTPVLKEEPLVSPDEAFSIERSLPHGSCGTHCPKRSSGIGIDKAISAKRTRERDLVLAMIIERLIHPCSKLATTRLWHCTTLAEQLEVGDADEDELYTAMDWLLARQSRIEKKLAKRHLSEGCQVLYDVSSSYYEGHTCPLARRGHSRDKKRGKPIIVYGDVNRRARAVRLRWRFILAILVIPPRCRIR